MDEGIIVRGIELRRGYTQSMQINGINGFDRINAGTMGIIAHVVRMRQHVHNAKAKLFFQGIGQRDGQDTIPNGAGLNNQGPIRLTRTVGRCLLE